MEMFLTEHKIWLDAFTAVGTVGATVVAIVLAIKASRSAEREILSGLKITDPDAEGVAYLENTTRIELRVRVLRNDELLDHLTQNDAYHEVCKLSVLNASTWKTVKEEMVLSPGERTALHLKNLIVEDTFVALSAIKVTHSRRTRYWIFRYAGGKAKDSEKLREETHPHKKWVLEFSAIEE